MNLFDKTVFTLLLLILSIQFSDKLNAQIAINTDGTDPDASAMFEVKSTEKGMLIPRMTHNQRS